MQVNKKNKNLWEAFKDRNGKKFDKWLENGANPEEIADEDTCSSTFELLCQEPDASEYLIKCLDYKADPNRENPYNGLYPIHIAVQNLAIFNIKILLEAGAECVNQTLKYNKTPLHLVTEVLNSNNIPEVFEIIKIFSKFGGDFSWPARQDKNQTPFQLLLEKLATFEDKITCLKIIRFLIEKNPRIDMFQRDKCAKLIRVNFKELANEYQVIESWKKEIKEGMNWKYDLVKLLEENEAEFLVMLDFHKKSNREELKDLLSDDMLICLSIDHDKLESFVEIWKMVFDNIIIENVAYRILRYNSCRILKYFLNHESIKRIDQKWMQMILLQMEDKEMDIDSKTKKCFHIVLNHPKYNVNEQIHDETALRFASATSEYAIMELLYRGASLGLQNNKGAMAIQSIDKIALEKFLDTRITTCIPEKRSDIDYYMVFNYSFLEAPNEMPPIEYMAKAKDLQSLIEHPVIASFLFLKWLRLSNIFYLNLLYFSISVITFIVYSILYFVDQHHKGDTDDKCYHILQAFAYWSFIMFSFKEISQFVGTPTNYLKSAENYFEFCIMCLMGVVLFVRLEDQQTTRRIITAVLCLALAMEWTLMFSSLPIFSAFNYIAMLKKVAVNFLRTLAFYSIILLAFAVSFYTLINKSEDGLSNSTMNVTEELKNSHILDDSDEFSMFSVLFHIVLMLTGEFGFLLDGTENIIIVRIFLLIFVLSMTIVLMNLLVGLTVSDTASIEKEAEWHKWRQRAKLLGKYELMACNYLRILRSCGCGWVQKFLPIVRLMPEYLPKNKIKVEISTFDSNKWIYIPKPKNVYDETEDRDEDIESDPFPLVVVKKEALSRSFFGCCTVPVEMNERIIKNGLEILKRHQQQKSLKELAKKEMAHRDDIKETLDYLKRQQSLKIENIELKLDQLLNQMQN